VYVYKILTNVTSFNSFTLSLLLVCPFYAKHTK